MSPSKILLAPEWIKGATDDIRCQCTVIGSDYAALGEVRAALDYERGSSTPRRKVIQLLEAKIRGLTLARTRAQTKSLRRP